MGLRGIFGTGFLLARVRCLGELQGAARRCSPLTEVIVQVEQADVEGVKAKFVDVMPLG